VPCPQGPSVSQPPAVVLQARARTCTGGQQPPADHMTVRVPPALLTRACLPVQLGTSYTA
jgi:hypothetical protein